MQSFFNSLLKVLGAKNTSRELASLDKLLAQENILPEIDVGVGDVDLLYNYDDSVLSLWYDKTKEKFWGFEIKFLEKSSVLLQHLIAGIVPSDGPREIAAKLKQTPKIERQLPDSYMAIFGLPNLTFACIFQTPEGPLTKISVFDPRVKKAV